MFNEKYQHQLTMFNAVHIITLIVLTGIIVLMFKYKNLFKDKKNDRRFRIILASFLLVFELSFHGWVLYNKAYSIDMLPLVGFCSFTNVLTIIGLYSNQSKLMSLTFYYAIVGAFFSLVFVDITYTVPHFRFFHYFLVHYGFLLGNIYFYMQKKTNITKQSWLAASSILLGYTMILLVLDVVLHKNWFYLMVSPVKELSDGLGKPWYTMLWILSIYVFVFIIYLVFKRKEGKAREKKDITL